MDSNPLFKKNKKTTKGLQKNQSKIEKFLLQKFKCFLKKILFMRKESIFKVFPGEEFKPKKLIHDRLNSLIEKKDFKF
jgi:hypothetical protein